MTRIADTCNPAPPLLTKIDVPNPDRVLPPGIYSNVALKIPRETPSLIVPSEAIVLTREGLDVMIVEDSVAHVRHVDAVRAFGTTVEVNSGVKEGDQVILNRPVDLTPTTTRSDAAGPARAAFVKAAILESRPRPFRRCER